MDEINALLNIADDASTAAAVIGRQNIEGLYQALKETSLRMQHISFATIVERQSSSEIAAELGVSLRMVEVSLGNLLKHCSKRSSVFASVGAKARVQSTGGEK